MQTIAWDEICRLKSEGGLRIKWTKDVNAAFHAKLGWKFFTEPDNIGSN